MKTLPLHARRGGFFCLFAIVSSLANAADNSVVVLEAELTDKRYELHPAASGTQRLTLPASAEVTWGADSSSSEKLQGDTLELGIALADGERLRINRAQLPSGALKITVTRLSPAAATGERTGVATTPVQPLPDTAPVDPAEAAREVKLAEALAALDPTTESGKVVDVFKKLIDAEALEFDPTAKADFAIPETPAAAILGQDAQVLRPATPQETTTALLSNLEDGKLKSGFALAVTPYTLLKKDPVSLRSYTDDGMVRFLTNLQVSIAGKQGTAAEGATDTPADFAIGVSGVFFDRSDLRFDEEFRDNLNQLVRPLAEQLAGLHEAIAADRIKDIDIPNVPQELNDRYDALRTAAERLSWNKAAASFGYAVRFESPTGKVEDAKEAGGAAWLNASLPGFGAFEDNGQFLFTATYRYDAAFNREGVTGIEDTFSLGAQFRFGTGTFQGYAEGFHHWREPKGGANFSETTLELGIEKKLVDGLWLQLGWTNDESLTGGEAIKTGLRYGFGKAVTLGSPAPAR